MANISDDQAFLNQALREAQGNEREEKLVLLRYQQAMLQAVEQFKASDGCAAIDLTMTKQRAKRLLTKIERYIATASIISMDQVKNQYKESQTLFGGIGQLCKECQKTLKGSILSGFRELMNGGAERED